MSGASDLVPGDTNGNDVFVRDLGTDLTTRVSVADNGDEAAGESMAPSISADGRFVAFVSSAENLVAGDSNGARDVFVRDRVAPGTFRVSIATGGAQANNDSRETAISGDGRFVAFQSSASNLVAGDTNGSLDIFVHDRVTGETRRVSVDATGAQANSDSYSPSISADGGSVAFSSFSSNLVAGDSNGAADVFVKEIVPGTVVRASVSSEGAEADAESFLPSLAPEGGHVVFKSLASNLVAGDTNGTEDIFLRDLLTGTTSRISEARDGSEADGPSDSPVVAGGALAVAFASGATNLVPGDGNFALDVFVSARPFFADGFESGDAAAWSAVVP
jgi:Tol biopolymer transport system component